MNVWDKCREAYRQGGLSYLLEKVWQKLRGRGGGNLYERERLAEAPAYGAWLAVRRPGEAERERQRRFVFPKAPFFSIVVPVYNTKPLYLEALVRSIRDQTYGNWELILADGASPEPATRDCLQSLVRCDRRLRVEWLAANEGISGNTNRGIGAARGDYIVFSDHDDLWEPDALFEIARAIDATGADCVYTDEDKLLGDTLTFYEPHQKPGPSPETLRSCNYVCHLMAASRPLLEKAGFLDSRFDGSQDHELTLRLWDATDKIAHVPKVLYHWRQFGQSMSKQHLERCQAAGRLAVREHLARRGLKGEVTQDCGYRVRYDVPPDLKVSVVLSVPGNDTVLSAAAAALREKTSHPAMEFLLLADPPLPHATEDVRFLPAQEGESPYAAWNRAAREATGEYLLFLDARLKPLDAGWLTELLMFAGQSDIGAVGGKLLYPGGERIFATNYCLAANGVVREFQGHSVHRLGTAARELLARNVSAVPEQLLLVKKADFALAGGVDEGYRHQFGDVDLCLRLAALGRRHIYTPFAVLEFAALEGELPLDGRTDYERLRRQWPDADHDPYCQRSWRDEMED